MKNNSSRILILLLVLFCCSSIMMLPVEGLCVATRTTVFVYNNLPSPLRAHVGSGGNDFGYRMINSRDNWHWGVCAYPNALYYCHLWWGSKQKAFDAFKGGFFKKIDPQINWVANESGIYYYTGYDSDKAVKKFDWEKAAV